MRMMMMWLYRLGKNSLKGMIEVDHLLDSKVRIFLLESIGTVAGISCRKQRVGWPDGFVLSGRKYQRLVTIVRTKYKTKP